MQWTGPHWTEVCPEELGALLYHRLEHCVFLVKGDDGRVRERDWAPSIPKVKEVAAALAAVRVALYVIDCIVNVKRFAFIPFSSSLMRSFVLVYC
jgi:hypothetical protein